MSDYIRLPRSALSLVSDKNLWQLYGYLLSKVDENGQWIVSLKEIHSDLGLTRQRVRTLFERLKSTAQLTAKSTAKSTAITLCIPNDKRKQPTAKSTAQLTAINDYVAPAFAEAWNLWLDYRKEINNNYKTEQSKRIGYEQFIKKSGNDPEKAMEMVRNTIANGYKGLFPTKDNGTKPITTADNAAARKESRDRLRTLAGGVVSQSADKLLNLYNGGSRDSDPR